jgi:Protein of unknown function (DUF3631)
MSFATSASRTLTRAAADLEAPWQALDLSMHKLASLLKPYRVRPRQNDARTARGYHAADFADPFRRYLTVQTVQPSTQAADQHQHPDSSADTSPGGNCPDTSAEADCPPNCPGVSAGQDGSADGWTVADTPLPETWDDDTMGAEAQR